MHTSRHVCVYRPTQVQSLLLRVASVSPHLLIHYAAAAANTGQTSADAAHNGDAMDHVKLSLQQQHSRLLKDTEIVFRELTKMTEVRGGAMRCAHNIDLTSCTHHVVVGRTMVPAHASIVFGSDREGSQAAEGGGACAVQPDSVQHGEGTHRGGAMLCLNAPAPAIGGESGTRHLRPYSRRASR